MELFCLPCVLFGDKVPKSKKILNLFTDPVLASSDAVGLDEVQSPMAYLLVVHFVSN